MRPSEITEHSVTKTSGCFGGISSWNGRQWPTASTLWSKFNLYENSCDFRLGPCAISDRWLLSCASGTTFSAERVRVVGQISSNADGNDTNGVFLFVCVRIDVIVGMKTERGCLMMGIPGNDGCLYDGGEQCCLFSNQTQSSVWVRIYGVQHKLCIVLTMLVITTTSIAS